MNSINFSNPIQSRITAAQKTNTATDLNLTISVSDVFQAGSEHLDKAFTGGGGMPSIKPFHCLSESPQKSALYNNELQHGLRPTNITVHFELGPQTPTSRPFTGGGGMPSIKPFVEPTLSAHTEEVPEKKAPAEHKGFRWGSSSPFRGGGGMPQI
jgi:hypothetical protein